MTQGYHEGYQQELLNTGLNFQHVKDHYLKLAVLTVHGVTKEADRAESSLSGQPWGLCY